MELSEKEKYLLKALLSLLAFIGNDKKDFEEIKGLVFTSMSNPPIEVRTRTPIGG